MSDEQTSVGQSKTVLVFGHGNDATSVISSITACVRDSPAEKPVIFAGPVSFADPTATHLCEMVYPLVRDLLDGLELRTPQFEVSATNLSAASALDLGVCVSGFSADTSVFLSLISVALDLPIPQSMVSTGHVASPNGDIRMVKNLPSKIVSAVNDRSIDTFIHPSLRTDISLEVLSPDEKSQIDAALASAKESINTVAASDVADLLKSVFSDEVIVIAALQHDYFFRNGTHESKPASITRAITFLCEDLDRRFWTCLEHNLLSGDSHAVTRLITERIQFQHRQGVYPTGFGVRLFQLMQAVPPATRRLKIEFPLVPSEDCLSLGNFAEKEDFEDIRKFFDAVAGDRFAKATTVTSTVSTPDLTETASGTLDTVLSEIAPTTLASNISSPIDTARASYVMDSVTVESNEEFYDIISAFYIHIIRHTSDVHSHITKEAAASDAYALLERTFARRDGSSGAQAEARNGIHGGVRFVLDSLTDQFKAEQQEKHVSMILKSAISSLEYEERVAFMAALLERLARHLPPDICSSPPERFADHCEPIVRAYVESLEKVDELLRRL